MKSKLIESTPLWVAAKAIRTAWQSHGKSDSKEVIKCPNCMNSKSEIKEITTLDYTAYSCNNCGYVTTSPIREVELGEADKALIKRVGVKFRHASTLEHITLYFFVTEPDIREFFSRNDFSTEVDGNIRTNLRVLVENKDRLKNLIEDCILDTELGYIFEEDNDDDSN